MSKFDFLEDNKILDVEKYPLLKGYSIAKNKPVITDLFFRIDDLEHDFAKEIESFLKHHSLKEALKENIGISSANITEFVNTLMFKEDEKSIKLNLNYYLIIDILSVLFLEQEKPNPDGFLRILNNRKAIALLAPYYNSKRRMQKFLNELFTEEKKIELIENSTRKDDIKDTLGMYMQDEGFFKTYFNTLDFKDKSTFQKCHDAMSTQMKKIATEDFKLKQETFCPELNNIDDVKFHGKNRIVVMKTYHDLITCGNVLGHCIGSKQYADKAYLGKCILLAICEDKELKYNIEIVNKSIIQIQGRSRSYPSSEMDKDLRKFLKENRIIA